MTFKNILFPSRASAPNYRPDIDGLRALAVASVLAFHAFPGVFKGGFIGVDIFFVISGYLISQIIFGQLETNSFSYKEFYSRRIRRIFPALITVMACSLIAGAFLQIADDYIRLAWQTIAGVFSVANLMMWSEAGYFDVVSNTKPLLHLWSLGVEEQFYIFWPLLLGIIWARKQNFLTITALIAAFSFAYSLYATYHNPSEAFFSPVTRLWELMLGGILAYMTLHQHRFVQTNANYKSIFGVILLVVGLVVLEEDNKFPGWWALLPSLGAFFIIAAGPGANLNKYLFSNRLAVFIGLISYPLYLWHWPILVFQRMADIDMAAAVDVGLVRRNKIIALLISVVLAYLTTRFIEKPIRKTTKPIVVYSLLTGALVLALIAATLIGMKGLPLREVNKGSAIKDMSFQIDKDKYVACPKALEKIGISLDYCLQSQKTPPTFAVFGDSHAEDKFYGLAKIGAQDSWILVGHNSCPPVYGLDVFGLTKDCQKRSEGIVDWLVDQKNIKTVILSHYSNYIMETDYSADHKLNKQGPHTLTFMLDGKKMDGEEQKKKAFAKGLDNAISRLEKAGKKVILFVDIPELPFFPKDCLLHADKPYCQLPRAEMDARQRNYRWVIAQLTQRHKHLTVFDPAQFLCDEMTCGFRADEISIYRDSHHLSLRGSDLYAQKFYDWFADKQPKK